MASLSFTNLRVFVDEAVHPIYSDLTGRAVDKAEDIPFTKMPDLFLVAACVGAKENKFQELSTRKRDIFVADAFETRVQIPVLIALAHKNMNNLEDLSDPKKILNICECWANGGIHLVHEQVLSGKGLRPLYRLIDFIIQEK